MNHLDDILDELTDKIYVLVVTLRKGKSKLNVVHPRDTLDVIMAEYVRHFALNFRHMGFPKSEIVQVYIAKYDNLNEPFVDEYEKNVIKYGAAGIWTQHFPDKKVAK